MAAVLAFDTSVTRYYQEEREWSVLSSKLSRAPKGCTASERNLSQEVAPASSATSFFVDYYGMHKPH
ncbi:hypothetical protein NC652_022395 [Populus alba x Populus x berolinensis]|nr:hypothetical protein NC652_022395 [Populus alba x Populus x berolinensis]